MAEANLFGDTRQIILAALEGLGLRNALFDVSLPNDPAFGDICTNAALTCAPKAGGTARALATDICGAIIADERVAEASVAGPGFVNVTLADSYLECVASSMITSGDHFGSEQRGGEVAICYHVDSIDPRSMFAGQVTANLAAHLGIHPQFVVDSCNAALAQSKVEAFFRSETQFGKLTVQELEQITKQQALVEAGFAVAGDVVFFAERDAWFRNGLLEALNDSQSAELICSALAPCRVDVGLSEEQTALLRLYILAHRADRALRVQPKTITQASAQNPAFLIVYAAMQCSQDTNVQKQGVFSAVERRLLCHAAGFPELLRLSYERAEPHRIGLFLLDCANLLLGDRARGEKRDPKTIDPLVRAATGVVFSVGLSILEVEQPEEIS